jgi:hypothetical protein
VRRVIPTPTRRLPGQPINASGFSGSPLARTTWCWTGADHASLTGNSAREATRAILRLIRQAGQLPIGARDLHTARLGRAEHHEATGRRPAQFKRGHLLIMRTATGIQGIQVAITSVALLVGCEFQGGVAYQSPPVIAGGPRVFTSEVPPPPPVEVIPAAPGPTFIWIGGWWAWNGGRWHWERGRWAKPPHPGAIWVPHNYAYHGGRHTWTRGGWQSAEAQSLRRSDGRAVVCTCHSVDPGEGFG